MRWRAVWDLEGSFRNSTSSHPFFHHIMFRSSWNPISISQQLSTTSNPSLRITMDFSMPSGSGTARVCMPEFGDMETFLTKLSQQIQSCVPGDRTILPFSSQPATKPSAPQTRSSSTRQNNTSLPASIHIHCWSTPMEYAKTKADLMLAPDVLSFTNAALRGQICDSSRRAPST